MNTNNSRKHVLLVDDDESILEASRLAFESSGYEVTVARDGAEALSRIERDAPDLVVLDLVMPRRSGFAVLDRIAESQPNRPRIMMVTANADPRHRRFATERGVDAFIAKPYEMSILLTTAAELLADSPG